MNQEHLDPLGKVLFNKGFKFNDHHGVHHPQHLSVATAAQAASTTAKPRLSFTTNKAGHLAASGQRSKIVLLKSSKPLHPPQQQQVVRRQAAQVMVTSSSKPALLVRPAQPGFVCDFTGCGQAFDRAALLRRHAKVHEGDVVAGKGEKAAAGSSTAAAAAVAVAAASFTNFTGLQHAKTLPFVCSICGMSFRFKGESLSIQFPVERVEMKFNRK